VNGWCGFHERSKSLKLLEPTDGGRLSQLPRNGAIVNLGRPLGIMTYRG